jgi:hypothetical protein
MGWLWLSEQRRTPHLNPLIAPPGREPWGGQNEAGDGTLNRCALYERRKSPMVVDRCYKICGALHPVK